MGESKVLAQQENTSQLVPEANSSETSDSSSESSLEGDIVKVVAWLESVVYVSSCITTVFFYKFTV